MTPKKKKKENEQSSPERKYLVSHKAEEIQEVEEKESEDPNNEDRKMYGTKVYHCTDH